MQKIRYISFATDNMRLAAWVLRASLLRYGITNFKIYNSRDRVIQDMLRENPWVEMKNSQNKAIRAGWWVWKPYIVEAELKKLTSDELLLYTDAGMYMCSNPRPFIADCKDDINIFSQSLYQGRVKESTPRIIQTTKRDCFYLMGADCEKYWNAPAVQGNIHAYRKSDRAMKFVQEWKHYCKNPDIVTESKKIFLEEYPEFQWHCHDQSVLQILAEKYNIKRKQSPDCRRGSLNYLERIKNMPYGITFTMHRYRKNNILGFLNKIREMKKYQKKVYKREQT